MKRTPPQTIGDVLRSASLPAGTGRSQQTPAAACGDNGTAPHLPAGCLADAQQTQSKTHEVKSADFSSSPSLPTTLCPSVTDNVVTEELRNRGTYGTDGTQEQRTEDLTEGNRKEQIACGPLNFEEKPKRKKPEKKKLVEPHANYRHFIWQSQFKDRSYETLIALIKVADPDDAARIGVSPEFHFRKLLKTCDAAMAAQGVGTDRSWKLEVCFEEWHTKYGYKLAKLTPKKDKEARLLEFLSAEVSYSYGESPLSKAGAASLNADEPPKEIKDIPIPKLHRLARFCREMARQDEHGKNRFFLTCRTASAIIGSEDHMAGYRLMNVLVSKHVLRVAKRGTPGENGKATRYEYIASDLEQQDDE